MSNTYGPDGKPTMKLPRASPAAVSRHDEITKVKCPVCLGCGMVPPEVAVLADIALTMLKDQS